MKTLKISVFLFFVATIFMYGQEKDKTSEMKEHIIFTTVKEARAYVSKNFTETKEILLISDSMNDAMGLNMAMIGDLILKKGYMPKGFEQKKGYRIYKYHKE